MIGTIIVDDEQPARDELRYLLSRHEDVNVLGEACNGAEALTLIREAEPDLVLLDVQMPSMSGMQLMQELSDCDRMPHVVFVTAFDDYAVHAFEVNAIDYLLKPVEEDRLAESLDRVRERSATSNVSARELSSFLQHLRNQDSIVRRELPPRLSVRKGDRYVLVDPADVTHGYILDGVVFLATAAFTGMTSHRTLEELEGDVDPCTFKRVHRSYVVNINHVTEVIPWQSGTYRLRLDDEAKTLVPLSRAQGKRLRKLLRW